MKEQLKDQEEEMLNRMIETERENDLFLAAGYYRDIPIPESLEGMVAQTIAQHAKKEKEQRRKMRRKKKIGIAIRAVGGLAAAIVLFMIPLNMSEAFAKQMQSVPVLGTFARVLTIRSYSYTENNVNVNVEVPEIVATEGETAPGIPDETLPDGNPASGGNGAPSEDGASAGGTDVSGAEKIADVNAEILQIVETYEEDAKQRFEEYKEAFFATGGTEEEWGGRTCDVDVEYTVTYQEDSKLSLILTTTESWAAVYAQRYYYNLDLQTGEKLTLKELLGENWVELCNERIVAEIKRRITEEDDVVYWGYGAGGDDDYVDVEGFESVSEQTNFYINESGNVVVCFGKYEIAPGYMGMQEFEIMDAE